MGSVVTNNGYSDWATTVISANIKSMWYRFSRREDDYCIECSEDGMNFSQMRICHMQKGRKIQFGIYASSRKLFSFKAVFSNMKFMECQWKALMDNSQIKRKIRFMELKNQNIGDDSICGLYLRCYLQFLQHLLPYLQKWGLME